MKKELRCPRLKTPTIQMMKSPPCFAGNTAADKFMSRELSTTGNAKFLCIAPATISPISTTCTQTSVIILLGALVCVARLRKKTKHAFKFIVDDEWRFAPDQPTVADVEGRINNFIDVSDFEAYTGDDFLLRRKSSADLYAREIPDLDEYTKDPPPLPPHLRHIILNKPPPLGGDPCALPVPQHVALNHLYCTAIKDGMMVLGVTLRYRQKATTTVYYSCS